MLTGLFALALASPQIVEGPSFDCTAALEPVEDAICSSLELARLDMRMDRRYVAVRRALSPEARRALGEDQRWFLGARNEWFEYREQWSDFPNLADRMSDRIAFLDGIDTRRGAGLTGRWRNAAGVAEIEALADGRLKLTISTASPVNARWTCEVSGTGQVSNRVLTVEVDGEPGWRILATVTGGMLRIEERDPDGGQGQRPYCGHNGHLGSGWFRSRAG
ncbi:hypothetical protein [Brevundimonas sp.]|uniref:lysozyme inhibitor LprI family protein n=1 Tax=Brevundimonas sp. TaxID=1871086 RepID=UPI002D636269|nr:hypothetical protein [Brevundimonas sp.]HYC97943.1 hypothetical protein [Brevundimonas sp.]